MTSAYDWHGRTLQAAMTEQPSLSLDFYSFGVMLRKQDGDVCTEYPVDPEQVAVALAAKLVFNTGLMGGDTLLVRQEGVQKTIVAYRKAQRTGIFLDASDTALRVPLPALIMVRHTQEDRQPTYQVFATKQRPTSLNAKLFLAPLPNVFNSGSICWGSVQRVSDEALKRTSLSDDWAMLLGSPFGDHACGGKSHSHPADIRQKLIELERSGAKRYPTVDLIPMKKTLGQVLGEDA